MAALMPPRCDFGRLATVFDRPGIDRLTPDCGDLTKQGFGGGAIIGKVATVDPENSAKIDAAQQVAALGDAIKWLTRQTIVTNEESACTDSRTR